MADEVTKTETVVIEQTPKPDIEQVSEPNYELEAMFGKDKRRVDDEWCFKRWINGESIEAMAAEFLVDENTLRKRMKKAVGLVDYKEGVKLAKEHREILKNGELKRILALGRKKTLELLHSNKIDDVKSLCRIEKVYGDRLALAENRPTEIQDRKVQIVSFKDLSQEEMAEQV